MQLNREFHGSIHRVQPEVLGSLPAGPHELITRSLSMRRITDQLNRLGPSRFILIEGEAGTGKRLLSSHIRPPHIEGGSAPGAQGGAHILEEAAVLFSGGPLPPQAVERPAAEASSRAARGVLVIRGIDGLDTTAQERLLRFLRSFENEAPTKTEENTLPARIICTSRQPLRARVLSGKFLPELYYRLSAVCFSLPPLRERKEDIPGLAQLFIETFSRERRRPLQGLGQGSLTVLLRHRWPGNVRELESVIRAACFSAESQWIRPIDLVILPLEQRQIVASEPAPPQDFSLDGVIRRHVQNVLKLCSGNKARAATRLGISRSTLYRMLDADSEDAMREAFPPSESTGTEALADDQNLRSGTESLSREDQRQSGEADRPPAHELRL